MPIRFTALLVSAYVFLELTASYALGVGMGFMSLVKTLQALATMGVG